MTRLTVFIVYADGQYRQRQFPSAEAARRHALEICAAFPDAMVQHGREVLQQPGRATEC